MRQRLSIALTCTSAFLILRRPVTLDVMAHGTRTSQRNLYTTFDSHAHTFVSHPRRPPCFRAPKYSARPEQTTMPRRLHQIRCKRFHAHGAHNQHDTKCEVCTLPQKRLYKGKPGDCRSSSFQIEVPVTRFNLPTRKPRAFPPNDSTQDKRNLPFAIDKAGE